MNALAYFVRTPSRYRRDAAIVSCLMLAVTLAPLFMLFSHLQPARAVGAEGVLNTVGQAAATPAAVTAPATLAAAAPAAPARTWPARGVVTLEFGAPDYPYEAHHTGIDIAGAANQQVVAFAAGTVSAAGALTSGCGRCVFVDHGNGLVSHYSHLSAISAVVGQHVEAGTPIGVQGSTGWSTGPHVHFEIEQNNVPLNPRSYVAGNPTR